MDPQAEAEAKRQRDMEAVRREMYRKSKDTIRIFNPLDHDFKFLYDGYPNIVKAHSSKDVERFIARHFFKKIAGYMIGELARAKGSELLEKHLGLGQGGYIDKFVENKEVWDKVPHQDDEEYLKIVAKQTILGLVEEYGLEIQEKETTSYAAPDTRDIHEQIADLFDNKLASEEPSEEMPLPEAVPLKEKIEMTI